MCALNERVVCMVVIQALGRPCCTMAPHPLPCQLGAVCIMDFDAFRIISFYMMCAEEDDDEDEEDEDEESSEEESEESDDDYEGDGSAGTGRKRKGAAKTKAASTKKVRLLYPVCLCLGMSRSIQLLISNCTRS